MQTNTDSNTQNKNIIQTTGDQQLHNLESIRDFGLYVLEENSMLRQLNTEDSQLVQQHLSVIISHSE